MDTDRWQRIQELFQTAVQRTPEDREAFLDQVCGDDAELRREVHSLLKSDSEADGFLQSPVIRAEDLSEDDGDADLVGHRVGRYQITGVIGRGGMGIVYEAVQETPKRTVALKLMRQGVASRSAMRRFHYETQIMGRLRHPAIAQIYDAGTHRFGTEEVAWFAMEFIPDARNILQFADFEKLNICARLKVFADVCDAVHHGHQKGVIHRDLKPSNILVDPSGQPKVIDFGVARAIDADTAIASLHTQTGQLIGTLQYMSPEQVAADSTDLDIRSDVYSLGVVLYELLTGRLPYQASSTGMLELARVVREAAPQRPSSMNPRLRGDIEWVILMALGKEPATRYQSAAEFVSDIRRYLSGEPILARPPTMNYALRCFVRQHRLSVAALVAFIVALVLGVLGATWAWRGAVQRVKQERDRADLVAYGAKMGQAEVALGAHDPASARRIFEQADQRFHGWEWRHLKARVDQSIRLIAAADTRVADAAIDPTGSLMAFSTGAGELQIVDVSTEPARTLLGLKDEELDAGALAFNANGTLLAVHWNSPEERRDSWIRLYWTASLHRGVAGQTAEWPVQGASEHGLVFHPLKPFLARSSDTHPTITLWLLSDAEKGEQANPSTVHPLKEISLVGHTESVSGVQFSPDGSLLSSSSPDKTIRLWDVDQACTTGSGIAAAVLEGHSDQVSAVAFNPDGSLLASASVDKDLRVWDVHRSIVEGRGVEADQPVEFEEVLTTIAFDATGARLFMGGQSGLIHVYQRPQRDMEYEALRDRRWALHGHEAWISRLLPNRNGDIISASADGTIRAWLPDTQEIPQLRGNDTSVETATFLLGGEFFVSAANGECLIVWDAKLGIPVARVHLQYQERIYDTAVTEVEGHELFAAATEGRTGAPNDTGRIIIWDVSDPQLLRRIHSFSNPKACGNGFMSVALSPLGTRLAAGTTCGDIQVYEISQSTKPALLWEHRAHGAPINSLEFLDDLGDWLVSGSGGPPSVEQDDHTIRMHHVPSGMVIAVFSDHSRAIQDLALSSDRRMLASASEDGTIGVWSVSWSDERPSLRLDRMLQGHTAGVWAVAFYPDGTRLASGSQDQSIKIWALPEGIDVATFQTMAGAVKGLVFDSDGEHLVSASAGFRGSQNLVSLWETGLDMETRRERAAFKRAYDEVLHLTRNKTFSMKEAKDLLASNPLLPQDARLAAVEHFEQLLPHPRPLIERQATTVLEDKAATQQQCLQALEWTEWAMGLAPENTPFLETALELSGKIEGGDSRVMEILRAARERLPTDSPVIGHVDSLIHEHANSPSENSAATGTE